MNKLPYTVTSYNICGEPTSSGSYRTENEARKKFNARIVSAGCSNVGRIKLMRVDVSDNMFARNAVNWINIDEWVRPCEEPEELEQEAVYIIHSCRTVGNGHESIFNKEYHTEKAAIASAKRTVARWSAGHPGALIFKAVKHVEYVSPRRAGIKIHDLA